MRKSTRTLLSLLFLAAALTANAQTDAQKAFASLKNMPGTWEGKTADGHAVLVSFKVVSGGTAVMSNIKGHRPDDLSMFRMDSPFSCC